MEAALKCNSLECRSKLTDQAVVTTCSHIFCIDCSSVLGLTRPSGSARLCPACKAPLANPDDIVLTQLHPAEDYKTSVLSGLSPTIIIECAGRALAFYAYQSTQELLYQEYLANGLTERHAALSSQMDQVIHDANSEILHMKSKLSSIQIELEATKKKHQELTDAYGEKARAHARTEKMYEGLKHQMLQLDVRTAAADAVSQRVGASRSAASPDQRPHHPSDAHQHRLRMNAGPGYGDELDSTPRFPRNAAIGHGGQRPVKEHHSPRGSPCKSPGKSCPFYQGASTNMVSADASSRTRLPFHPETLYGAGDSRSYPVNSSHRPLTQLNPDARYCSSTQNTLHKEDQTSHYNPRHNLPPAHQRQYQSTAFHRQA